MLPFSESLEALPCFIGCANAPDLKRSMVEAVGESLSRKAAKSVEIQPDVTCQPLTADTARSELNKIATFVYFGFDKSFNEHVRTYRCICVCECKHAYIVHIMLMQYYEIIITFVSSQME